MAYGEKDLLEKKLKTLSEENPALLKRVLTGCVQVNDYSGFLHEYSKLEVKNYPGYDRNKKLVYRVMEGTLYRLALRVKDVSREQFPGEGMVDMLEGFLKSSPNGEAEIEKQKQQQFPAGWQAQEEKEKADDKVALDRVVKALAAAPDVKATNDEEALKILAGIVKDASNLDQTYQAQLVQFHHSLNEFRDYLNAKLKEVIKTGKDCTDDLLVPKAALFF